MHYERCYFANGKARTFAWYIWNKCFLVLFFLASYPLNLFLEKERGSIINLSSIIGTNGNLGQTIYGSSKTAVIGFTKSLSKEVAPLNIRVNAIAPGIYWYGYDKRHGF